MPHFKSKYGLDEIVYLVTDVDQLPRMVTGIEFSPDQVLYVLTGGVVVSRHYDMEMTPNINESLRLGIDNNAASVN